MFLLYKKAFEIITLRKNRCYKLISGLLYNKITLMIKVKNSRRTNNGTEERF